jgi:hypothetical protein
LIVVSPTLLLLSGHKGSYISFVTTFSISGTTVTLGNTVSPFITGDSSGSFATISLFKIDASNYVQVAQDNVGAYTFRSRPFSLTGSTINPGTAQTWAVTGINGANQNPSRDYIVTRTDAYKIRHIIGIGGGGGNPIFTNGTLVIPRVVYGPLVFSVSGTGVLTSANGSNLTEYTGMTWGGNATRQWWTTDGKLYLSPYDGSAIKLATIGSGTITLGADYFVPPSTIGAGSDFPRSSEGFIVTDTFGFGTLKTSSGNRTYPLTVSNRFNVNVTLTVPAYSAEAALTANGSALVVSDQTRCWAGGIANNSVYLLDGCV